MGRPGYAPTWRLRRAVERLVDLRRRRDGLVRCVADLTIERDAARQLASATAAVLADRVAQRDELRAVLAPRLDNPGRFDYDRQADQCVWCGAWDEGTPIRGEQYDHAPDCPVRAAARLLGREGD